MTIMLAVQLKGGLGNQLFQLAAGDTISKETGRTHCLLDGVSPKTIHTDTNYFNSVFVEWTHHPRLPSPYTMVIEPSFVKQDWNGMTHTSVCLDGYFQNWRYISPNFQSRICLPSCPSLPGAFLHIRGGDYINNPVHDIGLNKVYYQSAIEQFPIGTHFYVFTNDLSYAKQCPILSSISHTIMNTDEVASLSGMASCSLGGICANSSFSWWGAYLNPNRTIVMPDKWFNTSAIYTEGYYFPGVIRCSV